MSHCIDRVVLSLNNMSFLARARGTFRHKRSARHRFDGRARLHLRRRRSARHRAPAAAAGRPPRPRVRRAVSPARSGAGHRVRRRSGQDLGAARLVLLNLVFSSRLRITPRGERGLYVAWSALDFGIFVSDFRNSGFGPDGRSEFFFDLKIICRAIFCSKVSNILLVGASRYNAHLHFLHLCLSRHQALDSSCTREFFSAVRCRTVF